MFHSLNVSKVLRISAGILMLVAIGFYGIHQAQGLIRGPIITIEYPLTGATLSDSFVEIAGFAKNAAFINLNGRQIFTDKNGYFKEKLIAAPGYSIIEISAQDKFGKTSVEQIEVVYPAQRQTETNI